MDDLNFGSLIDVIMPTVYSTNCTNTIDNDNFVLKNSDYHDLDDFVNFMKLNRNNFTIFSLNAQSFNAKFNEFLILIENLARLNLFFSMICIQETWIGPETNTSLYELNNYNYSLINQPARLSKHCGILIIS